LNVKHSDKNKVQKQTIYTNNTMQREAQRAKAMGGVLEGELPPPHQLGDLGERYKLSSVVWGEARAKGIFGVF